VIEVDIAQAVARIRICRPEVRNAFNAETIARLTTALVQAGENPDVRVIVIQSDGPAFCAGGDLNWMKSSVDFTLEENRADAASLARLFETIVTCPKPVIARVQGDAYGGGAGLVAACDISVVVETAHFSFSEVKLGLIPAVISPFVTRKIGFGHASRFFLTTERFDAATAWRIGLVSHVVANEAELDSYISDQTTLLVKNSPNALCETKKLLNVLPGQPLEKALPYCIEAIASIRVSPEGQEGVRAFLEKRKPAWVQESPSS
jgi:methylglutaconyl-CoA hydratase